MSESDPQLNDHLKTIEELQTFDAVVQYLERECRWKFLRITSTNIPDPNKLCARAIQRKPLIGEMLEHLRKHLTEGIIIEDTFGADHSARRKFLMAIGVRGSWLKQHSKLSANKLSGCIYYIGSIIQLLESEGLQIPFDQERVNKVARDGSGYPRWTFEQQVTFAQQIDDLISNLLLALSQAKQKVST